MSISRYLRPIRYFTCLWRTQFVLYSPFNSGSSLKTYMCISCRNTVQNKHLSLVFMSRYINNEMFKAHQGFILPWRTQFVLYSLFKLGSSLDPYMCIFCRNTILNEHLLMIHMNDSSNKKMLISFKNLNHLVLQDYSAIIQGGLKGGLKQEG